MSTEVLPEMVERLALALHAAQSVVGRPFEQCRICERLARVALEALREPTEGMVAAAGRLNHPRDLDVWRAMVSAALGEG
jgi:hypothetical protein